MNFLKLDAPISLILISYALILSILVYIDKLDVYDFYFNPHLIIHEKQFWRLFTSPFFFGSFSIETIITTVFFVNYVQSIERDFFRSLPADYLIFILFGVVACWIFGLIYPSFFLGSAIISYFLYYFSKRFPDLLFLPLFMPIPLPAPFWNFLFLIYYMITGNYYGLVTHIYGFFAAQIYFYLHDVLHVKYELNLLRAPKFANDFLNRLFRTEF